MVEKKVHIVQDQIQFRHWNARTKALPKKTTQRSWPEFELEFGSVDPQTIHHTTHEWFIKYHSHKHEIIWYSVYLKHTSSVVHQIMWQSQSPLTTSFQYQHKISFHKEESVLSLSLHSSGSWSITSKQKQIKHDMQSQSNKTVLVCFSLDFKSVDVH